MIRHVLGVAIVIVTALVLQSTVFAELRLLGVKPELLFVVTAVIALLAGPAEGAIVGFVSGMAQDFMMNQPKGLTALTLTLLGYAVGMTRQYIVSPSPLVPTLMVLAGTFLGMIFYEVVAFLLGAYDGSAASGARVAGLTALYNAVLTPIVYPVLRRVTEGARPRKVVRL